MKILNAIALLFLIVISFNISAADMSHCAKTTLKHGNNCGGPESSTDLVIKNNCKQQVIAKACFETKDKRWECDQDTVYPDEDLFFTQCRATGKYKVSLCSRENGKVVCGEKKPKRVTVPNNPKKTYIPMVCESGKKYQFKITPIKRSGKKNYFHITTKSGSANGVIKVRRDSATKEQYISVNDISYVLCSEPLEKTSVINSITGQLREALKETKEDYVAECSKEHHVDWCKKRYDDLQKIKAKENKSTCCVVRG